MSSLARKMRRDLGRSRRQFGAVAVMVVLGITFFVSLFGSMSNLRLSIERPYDELRFADVTVSIAGAPQEVVDRVAALDGVRVASGRVSVEAPATFPGRSEDVIVGRLLSVPAPDRPAVNDVLVVDGAYVSAGTAQVLAEVNFARHHGLAPRSAVNVTTPQGSWSAEIVGLAISPEYLWPARSVPEHMPDVLRRWGVLFLPYDVLAPEFGLGGQVNEISFLLRPGADRDATIASVRTVLEPYGISAVTPRDEQASEAVLGSLVGALDTLSLIFPLFFLIIVGLTTYVVLTRLVHTQRAQIGVLVALGLSRRRVLVHYLSFAWIVGILGSLGGALAGVLLSGPVTDLFAARISLPAVLKEVRLDVIGAGVGLSLLFASAAAALPAYRASREAPAETMRGENPGKATRRSRERRPSASRGSITRILPLRNVRRNPTRTAFTILALGLAGSLVIVPFGFLDTMDQATEDVRASLSFDLRVAFYRPVPTNVSAVLEGWDEVVAAEPFLLFATSVETDGDAFAVALYGVQPDSEAYRLKDRDGARVYVSSTGVLLGRIYEKRGLRVGDAVRMGPIETLVAGFVDDLSTTAFVPLTSAQEAYGMPGSANGMFLRLRSPEDEDALKGRLFASFPVWSVASTEKALEDWNEMLRLYYGFIGVIVAFGLALAAAIVFNAVTIAVLERGREIATMRTVGMRGRTIAGLITVENLLVLGASIVLGWILGYLLTGYFMSMFGSNTFVLDPQIRPSTYALSGGLLVGVLLVSQVPSLRHVQRLDLARATKERAG